SGNQTATEKTNVNLKRSEKPVYSPQAGLNRYFREQKIALPSFVDVSTIFDSLVKGRRLAG
ncbi:MAG TPA: hypothetical protein VGW77_11110, partial [Candidatus Binatia bacterium]|nr:hypothetical protein [Candidatus Binatia bacterium]